MAKIIHLVKYLADLADDLQPETIETKPLVTGFDICHCEECGRKVTHLILSAEGFFHCEPCQFMHIRRVAVQAFDSE